MAAANKPRSTSKDPRADELGRRVAARRKELGLSRRDVVDASGLSYPYVSQLETGYRLPSHGSLARLARALQLDPVELSAAIAYEEMALSTPAVAPAMAPSVGDRSMWVANPDYAERRKPSRTPKVRMAGVVEQVTALVSQLPLDQRLDALHRVQRKVVDQVVAEQIDQDRG